MKSEPLNKRNADAVRPNHQRTTGEPKFPDQNAVTGLSFAAAALKTQLRSDEKTRKLLKKGRLCAGQPSSRRQKTRKSSQYCNGLLRVKEATHWPAVGLVSSLRTKVFFQRILEVPKGIPLPFENFEIWLQTDSEFVCERQHEFAIWRAKWPISRSTVRFFSHKKKIFQDIFDYSRLGL